MRRSPVCRNSGRNVFAPGYGPAPYWMVKAMMTPGRRWYCAACGRTVPSRITGQRGHWEYRFLPHPRRGVTKGQWRQYQEAVDA